MPVVAHQSLLPINLLSAQAKVGGTLGRLRVCERASRSKNYCH
jgi:hypothetical protein